MPDRTLSLRHLTVMIQLRNGGRNGIRQEVLPKQLLKTLQYDSEDICPGFVLKL